MSSFKIAPGIAWRRITAIIKTRYINQLRFSSAPKTAAYASIKVGYKCEKYLTALQFRGKERRLLTQIRTGAHALNSERGRHLRSRSGVRPADAKLCQCCNMGAVEDPQHFIFECNCFDSVRLQFAQLFEKFGTVRTFLNSDVPEAVASYLYSCHTFRQQHLLTVQ